MSTIEHAHVHEHDLEPHAKVTRARTIVLMLIVSDFLSVLAIIAAAGYLRTLNTEGAFAMVKGDFAPNPTYGLYIMIGVAVSAVFYYLWEVSARREGSNGGALLPLLVLAFLLFAGAAGWEIYLGDTLKYGITIDAWESVQLFIVWFTGAHLVLGSIIGLLTLGRVVSGRIKQDTFIPETVGYWWYYTAISAIILYAFAYWLTR